ncbi:MAG: helix-turn-helix domain-containing protein [Clostridiales Family XIII bacterium]|nr:helix-turn-helix domain-containing protein [Clostridiales Family XIII bacterium]
MEYITPKEAAKLWGISERRAVALCSDGKIDGAERFGGKMWVIPQSAEKPLDGRTKEAKLSRKARGGRNDKGLDK